MEGICKTTIHFTRQLLLRPEPFPPLALGLLATCTHLRKWIVIDKRKLNESKKPEDLLENKRESV